METQLNGSAQTSRLVVSEAQSVNIVEGPPLRALVVSYAFPPTGGAGVGRPLKLVKYLGLHAVTPTVLSVSNPSVPVQDTSLLADLPPSEARAAREMKKALHKSQPKYATVANQCEAEITKSEYRCAMKAPNPESWQACID